MEKNQFLSQIKTELNIMIINWCRKICLEFEDEGMSELDCQGVEAMLIDWQGGFLGIHVLS